jgi:hypothetical protein
MQDVGHGLIRSDEQQLLEEVGSLTSRLRPVMVAQTNGQTVKTQTEVRLIGPKLSCDL